MFDFTSNSPASRLANSIFDGTSTGLWVISGPSGVEKTTYCTEIAAQAREVGLSMGGFVCPAVYRGDKKIGIDQIDIRTEERRKLGVWAGDARENTIGYWMLDRSVLVWGNEIIAGLKGEALIVIDSLGPLELQEGYGYQEALRLLDEQLYRTALVVIRPMLLEVAQTRWPQAQVLKLENMQS